MSGPERFRYGNEHSTRPGFRIAAMAPKTQSAMPSDAYLPALTMYQSVKQTGMCSSADAVTPV